MFYFLFFCWRNSEFSLWDGGCIFPLEPYNHLPEKQQEFTGSYITKLMEMTIEMGLFQSSKSKNIRKTAREVTYLGLPHVPARKARTLSSVCPFFKLSYIDLYCCFKRRYSTTLPSLNPPIQLFNSHFCHTHILWTILISQNSSTRV